MHVCTVEMSADTTMQAGVEAKHRPHSQRAGVLVIRKVFTKNNCSYTRADIQAYSRFI